ncbi:MAG TPA: MazG nucleotide pyrophosphohydrolase domain-containing protein [Deinococcales bacterium]|nr:MazG nucleotide pyrophosphohydrolase domain-containing protein [Deinococcales bacterium]
MERLMDIMRRLRAPDGCPWDRDQTHESLRPYLLEEAAEATEALADGAGPDFVAELGDVLLQIAFHAVIGEEEGTFAYADVEDAIIGKLKRRHPHVFGDVSVSSSEEVRENWLKIKEEEKRERGETGRKPDIPASLPVFLQIAEAHEKAGLEPAPGTELPGATEREVARSLVDVALAAAGSGMQLELAVRDELRRRLREAA